MKCTEGDKKFVRKKEKGTEQKDQEVWEILYDQYIKKYGLSKYYKRHLDQMNKLNMISLDYIITGNRFKLTQMELEQQKLTSMMNNNGKGVTIEQTLIHLSKWIGYLIKTREITVVEYFNLTSEFERHQKAMKNG